MKHATLFSGIGGPEIAAERLGWESVFTCEWEEFPRKILQYHFPKTKHYGDIRKLDATKYRGEIDVLTGGFPCQPFSIAGSRKGATDDRYLWPEMLRIIQECRPNWVIGENVSGLVTMGIEGEPVEVGSQTNLFEQNNTIYQRTDAGILSGICDDLEREGYELQTVVIPAEAVGAPHRRDRVFIIANADKSPTKHKIQTRGDVFTSTFFSDATDAQQKRLERENKTGQKNIKKRCDSEVRRTVTRCGREDNATDANEKLRKGRNQSKKEGRKDKRNGTKSLGHDKPKRKRSTWENFPIESALCGGNDGLPRELDGITFSEWRKESIKAYGNAIVPEVIFRIYEAIDKLSKL